MAHMEQKILTPFQTKILEQIRNSQSLTDQFYLTGGTALAHYYFQHRLSEDLDFFSSTDFEAQKILIWLNKVQKVVPLTKIEQQNGNGQLTLFLYENPKSAPLKIDFAYFPFEHLGNFQKDQQLRISSLEDIAINKVHAISSRARSRDYLDLMLCLDKLQWSTADIMSQYRLKFDITLPPESLATSLVNVTTAHDMPRFLGDIPWDRVETYFLDLVQTLKPTLLIP